jgi:hypothetical protein
MILVGDMRVVAVMVMIIGDKKVRGEGLEMIGVAIKGEIGRINRDIRTIRKWIIDLGKKSTFIR